MMGDCSSNGTLCFLGAGVFVRPMVDPFFVRSGIPYPATPLENPVFKGWAQLGFWVKYGRRMGRVRDLVRRRVDGAVHA
jgi:hypothetical protein